MNKIPNQVIQFAGAENLAPYQGFVDYFNHYRANHGKEGVQYKTHFVNKEGASVPITFDEKEEKLNAALKREILRVAGISNFADFPLETWSNHPTLKWATFAVISAMIDMVLPQTVNETMGLYSDVRTIGWGDSASFDVGSRDLFVVSKAGRSKRLGDLHKQFRGQITVTPQLRQLTVYVGLMAVLAGKESLADFAMKMIRSFELAIAEDVYTTMSTAMAALDTTAVTGLRVTGFTVEEFARLSQTVSAWNGGARVLAIGTQVALAKILPDNANYRYDLESDYVRLGYIRNFHGTDIMAIPQVANWTTPFGLKLDDTKIWIISPSSDKLVKVVLEGSALSYTSGRYDYANLIQTSTIIKSWGTAIATSGIAAEIDW